MRSFTMERALYLFWHGGDAVLPADMVFHGEAHQLTPGLWLVRSDLPRSKLYHELKWQLPEGTALLVSPLTDDPDGWPKFKGTEAGALAWLREGV